MKNCNVQRTEKLERDWPYFLGGDPPSSFLRGYCGMIWLKMSQGRNGTFHKDSLIFLLWFNLCQPHPKCSTQTAVLHGLGTYWGIMHVTWNSEKGELLSLPFLNGTPFFAKTGQKQDNECLYWLWNCLGGTFVSRPKPAPLWSVPILSNKQVDQQGRPLFSLILGKPFAKVMGMLNGGGSCHCAHEGTAAATDTVCHGADLCSLFYVWPFLSSKQKLTQTSFQGSHCPHSLAIDKGLIIDPFLCFDQSPAGLASLFPMQWNHCSYKLGCVLRTGFSTKSRLSASIHNLIHHYWILSPHPSPFILEKHDILGIFS